MKALIAVLVFITLMITASSAVFAARAPSPAHKPAAWIAGIRNDRTGARFDARLSRWSALPHGLISSNAQGPRWLNGNAQYGPKFTYVYRDRDAYREQIHFRFVNADGSPLAVPEPGSFAAPLAGALLCWRRRRNT